MSEDTFFDLTLNTKSTNRMIQGQEENYSELRCLDVFFGPSGAIVNPRHSTVLVSIARQTAGTNVDFKYREIYMYEPLSMIISSVPSPVRSRTIARMIVLRRDIAQSCPPTSWPPA
jgi:hypothetical protein